MAIAAITYANELSSRLHLLSSSVLALFDKPSGAVGEFDLMDLNALYRLLEDFKTMRLTYGHQPGVLGISRDEEQASMGIDSDDAMAVENLNQALKNAYPDVGDPNAAARMLQWVLVKLSGLEPKESVSPANVEAAKNVLRSLKNFSVSNTAHA